MKRILSVFLLSLLLFYCCGFSVFASVDEDEYYNQEDVLTDINSLEINAKSAILMDADTGYVIYAKNASTGLPPASVTKVMTLLLVAEAIDLGKINLSDNVLVSANAASKGGSQIFLKEGESFTVEELLKSTVIASANDAAVALAELVAGTESAFVDKMNRKAEELGMKNTHFENATGLDDSVTSHYISAYDIALMSRELIKYDVITRYSNVWQDSIRNGEFVLTNTNRLVRYYDGCTGLKTGSTSKAGFCVSATAKRGNMHLIAVVMGAETRDERNDAARAMLDFGFSNFELYLDSDTELEKIEVLHGVSDYVTAYSRGFSKLLDKGNGKLVEKEYLIPYTLKAPLTKGDVVGKIVYRLDGKEIGESEIYIDESVGKVGIFELFARLIKAIFTGDGSF